MTEKEKMLNGETYNAYDPILVSERAYTRTLLRELNINSIGEPEAIHEVLSRLLPNAATDIEIEPPFYCDYGYNIKCGTHVFMNFNCTILDVCPVTIGSHVFIGPNVQIYTATHPLNHIERRSTESAKSVSIGDDTWIGGNVTICPGVFIGKCCVIGAGSVVVKNIPDNSFAAGNPAKVIRKL